MIEPSKTPQQDRRGGSSLPPLPDAIRARLRDQTLDVGPAAGAAVAPAAASLSIAQRIGAMLQRSPVRPPTEAVGGDMPRGAPSAPQAIRARLGGLVSASPAWLSRRKLDVKLMSPVLRDGLISHGRRAGMNIGTAIDKIIRDVPVAVPATAPIAEPNEGWPRGSNSDIATIALQRAVKQPSIFAPGHLLTALIAGGIIHIMTTFAITSLGTGSAYRQLRTSLPANELVALPVQTPGTQLLPYLSPDMLYSICRFDLSGGALEVKAMLPEAGWSLALYTRQGDNFYAVPGQSQRPVPVTFVLSLASDRLVGLTPGVRKYDVDVSQVTSPDSEGLMVLRAPLKGVAFEAAARAELKRATCAPARR